nr:MAG TPA: hypothetical protein [Caudoviricetes sp.]
MSHPRKAGKNNSVLNNFLSVYSITQTISFVNSFV